MKYIRQNKALIFIFVVALVVRLLFLGTYPLGFHEDEIRVGWNAYSILKTGKDDLGNRFALYYNTFGDYRPTGIFYLTIPSLVLFGLTEFAVRFPSALVGALTIFPVYFFCLLLPRTKLSDDNKKIGLLAALFMALSPWHVFVSRATSEGIISLFFALCGLCFFLLALKSEKNKYFITAFFLLALSSLFYHMTRPLTPLFLAGIVFYYWKTLSRSVWRKAIITTVATGLFSLMLLSTNASRGRFSQVSVSKYQDTVLGSHTSAYYYPTEVKNEYVKYLGLEFLTGDSPKPYRYRVFGVGLISAAAAIFLTLGLITIAQRKTSWLPLLLLLIAPLPAAVTGEDAPNLHRALFMLPFIAIIAAFGAFSLRQGKFVSKISYITLILFFLLSSILSLGTYFRSGAMDAAPYRNFGTKVVAQYLIQHQKNYQHIYVSDDPDPLYPWYAFAAHEDPKSFNQAAIARLTGTSWTYHTITFTQNKCPSSDVFNDKTIEGKILVVDAPDCDVFSLPKAHPEATLTLLPARAPKESQYHFWERR